MANKIFKGLKFPGMDDYYVLPEAVITKNEDGIIEIESYMPGESNIVIDKTLSTSGAVAEAKAVGDALQNKVSVVEGSRLLTQEEANKLAKLVIDEDGNVGSTNIINVGNAEGILAIAHGGTGNNTGYIQTGAKEGSSIGSYATAEGFKTTVSGQGTHAEGQETTASGLASHAEGLNTTTSEQSAHAEGWFTTAAGQASHAEGYSTQANADSSHAEGLQTIASSRWQHVQGKYNVEDVSGTYAHIVGNGSSTTRSNAHTLDWDGNAWFAGSVTATNIPIQDSANAGCYYYKTSDNKKEWINPPMVTGQEYRTTERFDGKPVYTKLYNLGVVSTTEKTVSHGLGSNCFIIKYIGSMDRMPLPINWASSYQASIAVSGDQIKTTLSSTYAGQKRTIKAQLWYVKS